MRKTYRKLCYDTKYGKESWRYIGTIYGLNNKSVDLFNGLRSGHTVARQTLESLLAKKFVKPIETNKYVKMVYTRINGIENFKNTGV